MAKKNTYKTIKRNDNRRRRPSLFKIIVKALLLVLGIIVVLAALVFGTLTIFEYRPEEKELLGIEGEAKYTIKTGEPVRMVSWNLGYGALGDNADFFMDGGKGVMTADESRLISNMEDILSVVKEIDPDIMNFQEVDINSARSFHIDESRMIREHFPDNVSVFADNYRVLFVPYPIPPMGHMHSGIMTDSKYTITDSTRVALPIPFKWPVRLGNLKRCLMVSHFPVEGSNKELTLINLHLEAYDNGDGKEAQTAMLKQVMEEEYEKGNYVIVTGDFNQVFSDTDISAFPAYEGKWQPGSIDTEEFKDTFNFYTDGSVPSCRSLDQPYIGADRSSFQYYVIDGYIVSDNVSVDSVATLDYDFHATDHNPVVLEFSLNVD